MMADIVRPENRVRAFSLSYWAINLGFAISSMAAGFIAEVSYRAGFLLEAGMTAACAIVVFHLSWAVATFIAALVSGFVIDRFGAE